MQVFLEMWSIPHLLAVYNLVPLNLSPRLDVYPSLISLLFGNFVVAMGGVINSTSVVTFVNLSDI